ncbi:hypothetical protein [Nocardia yunnanensis]|uniref:hypothetical protein n=1 Tax=Nocardia yunnanensis TaxID=2382165 RepID=UPI0013C414DA|nr:hypothetical protein [Nocardia yunnanensis]
MVPPLPPAVEREGGRFSGNGSSAAAGLELQTEKAVMAIGGFSGSDPTPTLAEFQADVKAGKIGYYILQNNGRGGIPRATTGTPPVNPAPTLLPVGSDATSTPTSPTG